MRATFHYHAEVTFEQATGYARRRWPEVMVRRPVFRTAVHPRALQPILVIDDFDTTTSGPTKKSVQTVREWCD